jgi:hypothetical protein
MQKRTMFLPLYVRDVLARFSRLHIMFTPKGAAKLERETSFTGNYIYMSSDFVSVRDIFPICNE